MTTPSPSPSPRSADAAGPSTPQRDRRPAVLLLHPGAMGSQIGARLRERGTTVTWVAQGRSEASARRASEAGLERVETLADALGTADIALSVCPPHGALELARAVQRAGFRGIFVDANAVSPARALKIGGIVEAGGARFVDGGIIGPPPRAGARARLYLSGDAAASVSDVFDAGPLSAIVLPGPVGKASALKMAFAAWNKGSIALLASIRALAGRHGLDDALLDAWRAVDPEVIARAERVAANAGKAWRWEAEMHEIADTFGEAGLPEGFHRGAAEVYARMAGFKDGTVAASVDALNDALNEALLGPAGRAGRPG
ncbi:MAG: DUF1932 domain-containing protein [Lautropia sp.]